MIKNIILLQLLFIVCHSVSSQTYELKGVSVDGNFRDSFYIKLGTDSLFGEENGVYTFRSRQGTIQYTSETNITGNTIPVIAPTLSLKANQSALVDTAEDIRTAVNGKQPTGSYSLTSHAHAYSEITSPPTIPTNTNQLTNGAGFITGITSGNVTTALGFTPYNSTNPNSYITASALTPYLTTATAASTYQPVGSYLVAADIAGKLNTNGSAAALTNFPTFNQNTSGTAAGLSAVLSFANGGISASAATSATTGTMTVNMTSSVVTITPTGACTFNASGGVAGQIVTFSITTSGTSSFVLTFGTNFRKVGTLATGTTSARFFTVTFICINGVIWQEIARTAVQT